MALRILLSAVAALPALAVSWGTVDGRIVFVLYREPKLAAALVLTSVFLGAVVRLRPELLRADALRTTLRRPPVLAGCAFLAWAAVGGLWSRVPDLYLYEMQQLVVFGLLWIVPITWFRDDPGSADVLRAGIVAGCAGVTLVGLFQWSGLVPALGRILAPIDPQFGAAHPSLMGYKNPAALAVAGQFFLLVGLAIQTKKPGLRLLLGALTLAELVYLASLNSRTAYLAIAVGGLGTLLLFFAYRPRRRPDIRVFDIRVLGGAAALVLVFLATLLWNPTTRARAASMGQFLSLEGYLASDRGTYLKNTLAMVDDRPAGVGLGQWQVFYPVSRKHDPRRSFDETFQVRRAHSDHVQVLGETGPLGLALWSGWITLLIWTPARRYASSGHIGDLFVAVQVLAVATAMAGDYVTEMPFHKLQFFLLAALSLADHESTTGPSSTLRSGPVSPWRTIVPVVLVGSMLVFQAGSLRREQLSAEVLRRHALALDELRRQGRTESSALGETRALGRAADRLPGWSKTSHRRHLALGHIDLLLGDVPAARARIACALDVHPYSSKAMALMAEASPPEESVKWKRASRHLLEKAMTPELPEKRTECLFR